MLAGEIEAPPTDPAEALRLRQAEEDERRHAEAAARREQRSARRAARSSSPKPTAPAAAIADAEPRTVKRRSTQRETGSVSGTRRERRAPVTIAALAQMSGT